MMARILFVHIRYPEFDRCSGDVRVANMIRIMAQQHEVSLHVMYQPRGYLDAPANSAYAELMRDLGVQTFSGSLSRHLQRERYDAVVIEFWYVARPILHALRVLQPQARVIVDTEHVHFYSDQVRAANVGSVETDDARLQRKRAELALYGQVDAVITTTDEDAATILSEDSSIICHTIPNIHILPEAPIGVTEGRRDDSLVFVGSFRTNQANADAMVWFTSEIMPRILRDIPGATLRIVGDSPPPTIAALSGPSIEVTGYVPDTAPYLDTSMLSVCPLRFGAGLKGKVGEAMAHGLPVVATSIGTQGMVLSGDDGIVVADDADAFAQAVVSLLGDRVRWRHLSQGARAFVECHFGFSSVERRIEALFGELSALPAKRVALGKRIRLAAQLVAQDFLDEHVRWRWRH